MAPTEVAAPPFDLSQFPTDPNQWINVEAVTGQMISIFFATRVQIGALQTNHTGSGDAFGPALGLGGFAGGMGHKGWPLLTSATNQFYIGSGALGVGGVLIYFAVNGQPAAIVAAAEAGLIASIGLSGSFTWR